MIETESQRRWWFATHPEFSKRRSITSRARREKNESKIDPKEVDAYVDRGLQYLSGPVADLLRYMKRNLGTEALAEADYPSGKSLENRSPLPSSNFLMADTELARLQEEEAKKAFIDLLVNAGWSREAAESKWNVYKFNERLAKKTADAVSVYGALSAARLILAGMYRWAISAGEIGAIGQAGGPGKWVEVCRGPVGLAHQSKMSGQRIQSTGGKLSIREYEVNGVKFDNYANGKLYEYKGDYSNFINKNGKFHDWFRGADELQLQAQRQVQAAKGIPVIWKVGPNQLQAFKHAIDKIPGLTIEP